MRKTGTAFVLYAFLGAALSGATAETARPGGAGGKATAKRADVVQHQTGHAVRHVARRAGHGRLYATYGGISCVPYARMVTGIQVTGNGGMWWHNAAGSYDRDQRPEPGAVMAFRSSGGMRSGHVAVVSRVLGPRHVTVDHANWGGPGIRKGTEMRDVNVIDVSENNDWTAVRVQVGWDAGSYGRTYPTFGFIHNRPDTATAFASTAPRGSARFDQVAEMPERRATRSAVPSHTIQGLDGTWRPAGR